MKKINIRAVIALLLCIALVLPLVGCSSDDIQQLMPDEYFESVRTDSTLVYNTRGEFSLNVLSDTADFNEGISIDDITVCYGVINDDVLPEIDSEKGILLTDSEYDVHYITPSNVTRNSARSVTVDFADPEFDSNRPANYILVFDRESNSENKYLCAGVGVRYPSFSLVSDVSQITSDAVPVRIRLTLDTSVFTEDISADDIVLSGSFKNSDIGGFERIGENTLSFTIDNINSDYIKTGKITVSHTAVVDAPQDVSASIRVVSPAAYFSADSLSINGNNVKYTINLQDCQFAENISADMIAATDEDIKVTRFERVSQSQANVTMVVTEKNIGDIPTVFPDITFTISSSALNISDPVDYTVDPGQTDVSVRINSLTQSGSGANAVLEFTVTGGTFNAVSKSSFAFTGDFASAEVTSITSQSNTALVQISISDISGKSELLGSVGLRTGSVANYWGVSNSAAAVPLYYSFAQSNVSVDGFSGATDLSSKLLDVLTNTLGKYDLSDISYISDIMNDYSEEEESVFGRFAVMSANNMYIEPIFRQSMECISNEHLSQTGEHIKKDRAELTAFMSDLQALWAASRRAAEYLPRLAELEEQIETCDDENELLSLNEQYREYADIVISTGNSTVKGMSYSTLLVRVMDEYNRHGDAKSALGCFDNLTDCMYNWQTQTEERKSEFRYAVDSVILQSVYISVYSMSTDTEKEEEAAQSFKNVVSKLKSLSGYLNSSDASVSDYPFTCNTLGKSIELEHFDFNVIYGEITSDEIVQLLSMIPADTTLREELGQVGFDVSSVRYLVCSDSAVSSTLNVTQQSINGKACMLYTVSSKATVYDLIRNEFVNEFEYENITTVLSTDGSEVAPALSQLVNTALKLYSMK
ncbi:MAG: hypothetical protein J1E39_01745 [Eubacterium sp.]|nr:hypothetical protein [Eubacterium sp.]